MKTVWMALGVLGFISGAAFLVFWLLAWTRQVPPGEPLTTSCGVMLLVTGLFCIRGTASKTADRGKWARSNVKVGQLSAFGFGVVFCSIGAAFLGFNWLPKQLSIWLVGAVMAGFALTWVGQALDGRAYKRQMRAWVNGLPEEQREKIRGLARSGHRLEAIKEAKHLLGISLGDAAFVAKELKD